MTTAKPRVLVTGATGFAGSHLADLLLEEGYAVRVMVRESSNLRWIRPEMEKVVADVRDRSSLGDAVKGVQWVFHYGGIITARNRAEYFAANARGTKVLYEVFAEESDSPELFFFCSSLAASGPSRNGSLRKETDTARPMSSYGASKKAAEDYLTAHGESGSGPRVVVVRPPAVYGPRDELILKFARSVRRGWIPLPAPPHAEFGMIHVEDLARGTLLLAEKGLTGVFNINDGERHTWENLARFMAEELQVRARFLRIPPWVSALAATVLEAAGRLSGKPPLLSREKVRDFRQSWISSIEKVQSEAGFEPRWKVQEGLRHTLRWYRNAGWI